ncbi:MULTISPECIES: TetR/AcrR family transcriptional regulator [unclassified Paraburkholderia]|uniref:TetR/AcrR family transcriptional regulator n=1 Tax=unclassified Paraburkholderia TaxID=2615204 RepID=UPI001982491C|nr:MULTISPECIES: TetR/AcrR family transcriptional regulator [unclassified Paraburkholderia]MBN3857040.1 TetR/AcrR family transcriptional regulator [Paraburkholderia sp. Ac-20340]
MKNTSAKAPADAAGHAEATPPQPSQGATPGNPSASETAQRRAARLRASTPETGAAPSAPASGTRRKKAPVQVRAQLLQAASEIATDQGVPAVTLDAVAERAGVTKGALQYHFANKQGLLDALFEQTLERFEGQMEARLAAEEDNAHGARARAYLHSSIDEMSPAASTNVLRVLVAAMMTDPDIRERYAAPMRKWTRPDPLPLDQAARLMICRLAADGLWISDLLGYQDMSPEMREEVVRQIEKMTLNAA